LSVRTRTSDQRPTYAKLNRNRKKVNTSGLSNSLTTGDTGEIDEAGLDDALLTLGGPQELLGESMSRQIVPYGLSDRHLPETSVGHGESGRASTVLSLDDLITAELDA
jgi:hypothetical protein